MIRDDDWLLREKHNGVKLVRQLLYDVKAWL